MELILPSIFTLYSENIITIISSVKVSGINDGIRWNFLTENAVNVYYVKRRITINMQIFTVSSVYIMHNAVAHYIPYGARNCQVIMLLQDQFNKRTDF